VVKTVTVPGKCYTIRDGDRPGIPYFFPQNEQLANHTMVLHYSMVENKRCSFHLC
jgi:hypothetical protein